MTTGTAPRTDQRTHPGPLRAFTVLNGLVLLGVVFQGLSAGLFMAHLGVAGWLRVHQVVALVTAISAVAAAILAIAALRRRRRIVAQSCGLFVLLVVQTGLGQAISEGGHHTLVAAHVPIAVVITALSAYLSVTGVRLPRSV